MAGDLTGGEDPAPETVTEPMIDVTVSAGCAICGSSRAERTGEFHRLSPAPASPRRDRPAVRGINVVGWLTATLCLAGTRLAGGGDFGPASNPGQFRRAAAFSSQAIMAAER